MDSTAKPTPAGAEDLLLPQGDTRPNADYERVVREELARVQERLAQLAPAGMSAAAPPEVKVAADTFAANDSNTNRLDANVTAFRAPDISGIDDRAARPPARRGVVRILTGLLVTGAIVGAGAAWASYGEAVRPMIGNDSDSQASRARRPCKPRRLIRLRRQRHRRRPMRHRLRRLRPIRYRPMSLRCCKAWRMTLLASSKASTSSRPVRSRWPATMPDWPNS
jgi:hypothetical protein